MITKRNGKYYREKVTEEEISAIEALEERIANLEAEIADLKRQRICASEPIFPSFPPIDTPYPNGPIWIISNDITY